MFKILKNMESNNNLKLSLPKSKQILLRGAIAWNSLPSEFLREVDKSKSYFSLRNLLNNYYKIL